MRSLYVGRSEAVAARMMGGEIVVISPEDSSLFTLNAVASCIWNSADGDSTLEQIVRNQVCAEFEVGFDAALEDAAAFVREGSQHGILQVSEQPLPRNPQVVLPTPETKL
ncbi:MAG TPA: PqqD family protein [Terriglobales bacterium]|nr:PqqD family protein [Terriglobales bacterium]